MEPLTLHLDLLGILAPWDRPYHGHGDGGSIWQKTSLFAPEKAKLHAPGALGGHGVNDLGHDGIVHGNVAAMRDPVPRVDHCGDDLDGGDLDPGLTAIELL